MPARSMSETSKYGCYQTSSMRSSVWTGLIGRQNNPPTGRKPHQGSVHLDSIGQIVCPVEVRSG